MTTARIGDGHQRTRTAKVGGYARPHLLPVLALQALWVRARIEELPPAAGPTDGVVAGSCAGSEPALRLAVIGDSTAAGCGVDTHDEGIVGALARELSTAALRPVHWEVVGQHGATSLRIRHRLLPELRQENFDVAVLLAGANDVLGRRTPAEWHDDLSAILADLTARAAHVVVAGIPPFAVFPSLPGALAGYLSRRAAALDEVADDLCAGNPRTTWIDSAGLIPADVAAFFARDRFHPSALGYRMWAQAIVRGLPLAAANTLRAEAP
ncbi:SGNH/GDSL hydrolase family protein (plasmid) [Streptomycetaceae bacterium NBC_01309]